MTSRIKKDRSLSSRNTTATMRPRIRYHYIFIFAVVSSAIKNLLNGFFQKQLLPKFLERTLPLLIALSMTWAATNKFDDNHYSPFGRWLIFYRNGGIKRNDPRSMHFQYGRWTLFLFFFKVKLRIRFVILNSSRRCFSFRPELPRSC